MRPLLLSVSAPAGSAWAGNAVFVHVVLFALAGSIVAAVNHVNQLPACPYSVFSSLPHLGLPVSVLFLLWPFRHHFRCGALGWAALRRNRRRQQNGSGPAQQLNPDDPFRLSSPYRNTPFERPAWAGQPLSHFPGASHGHWLRRARTAAPRSCSQFFRPDQGATRNGRWTSNVLHGLYSLSIATSAALRACVMRESGRAERAERAGDWPA
jgi:hypothetical protein